MKLESPAFKEGGMIPEKYTCEGADVSPPLTWKDSPEGTKSFALVCDDPDAPTGTWVHWVYFNIPSSVTGLPENVDKSVNPRTGGKQGINDFRTTGYGGPCPPGGIHRYFFRLYALDNEPDMPRNATVDQLESQMDGHILEKATLMGRYQR